MKSLRLTLRNPPLVPLDASPLRSDVLTGMTATAILRLPLTAGRESVCVGDLFSVQEGDPQDLIIQGDCRRLQRVGAGMSAGRLRVMGDVGDGAGRAMCGGELIIAGNAGDAAGQAMRGGRLRISGNAGARVAAPDVGERSGMSGGWIVIDGDAGEDAGFRMRRGMLLIAGTAGAGCAAGMVAGTIAVGAGVGPRAAAGMRRGTLLLAQPTVLGEPDTFAAPLPAVGLGFLPLLVRSVARHLPVFAAVPADRWRRTVGDLAVGGLGEILWPEHGDAPAWA